MHILEYRVVEMEDNSFRIEQRLSEDTTWLPTRDSEDFVTAAFACKKFKERVAAQKALMASMTMRKVVMTEEDL